MRADHSSGHLMHLKWPLGPCKLGQENGPLQAQLSASVQKRQSAEGAGLGLHPCL